MATDWLPELDDDDLAVLVEALEAWESKDAAAGLFGLVVDSAIQQANPAIQQADPRAFAAMREELTRAKLERDRAGATRKERSVLLRAKLITLRRRRAVERVRVPPA